MKTQRNILIAATVFLALAASPLAATSSACTPEQEAEILALFTKWNTSLATGNAARVEANYAQNAVLIPTLSNEIRNTPAGRIAYFEKEFLPKKPSGKINQHYLKCIGDIAINSGLYTFTFGDRTKARARYTFVYQKQRDGKWLIIEHHSSGMPKP
jgi:uncharacterized protein (TIGR02246 family)